jgi:hypothetical protein
VHEKKNNLPLPNNLKAHLNTFQMSTNVMALQWSRKITNIFGHSGFGDKSRTQSLKS